MFHREQSWGGHAFRDTRSLDALSSLNCLVIFLSASTVVAIATLLSLAAGIMAVKTKWSCATIVVSTTRNTANFLLPTKHANLLRTCSKVLWKGRYEMTTGIWWMESWLCGVEGLFLPSKQLYDLDVTRHPALLKVTHFYYWSMCLKAP